MNLRRNVNVIMVSAFAHQLLGPSNLFTSQPHQAFFQRAHHHTPMYKFGTCEISLIEPAIKQQNFNTKVMLAMNRIEVKGVFFIIFYLKMGVSFARKYGRLRFYYLVIRVSNFR